MKAFQTQLSRRDLIKGSAALGFSALTPALLLAACGGGDSGASQDAVLGSADAALRETRDLQFDFSLGQIAQPKLHLANSRHDKAALISHTHESRARFRQIDPVLKSVPDEKLTHYLEGVDVPATALQLGSVWGVDPVSGRAVHGLNFVHVPTSSLDALVARRLSRGQKARALSSKLQHYGVSQSALDEAPIQSQIGPMSAPFDVACALIFQHPAITNLDPDLGADIMDRVQSMPCGSSVGGCTPYSGNVAFQIALMIGGSNYPTMASSGSWATLATIEDLDTGLPCVDVDGNPIYSFTINPALKDPIAAAVKGILSGINNDPLFMGTNWQSKAGETSEQPVSTAIATAARQAVRDAEFTVVPSIPIGARRSGIRLKNVECDDKRNVVFTVVNEYIRSAGVYVQYYDATGKSLKNTSPDSKDDGDAYYNSVISPQVQIMGIPLQGKQATTTSFRFTLPDEAASAVVYYGGLGLGGSDAFSKKALIGTIMTMTLNLALPTLCLAQGIHATYNQGLTAAFENALEDPITRATILAWISNALASGALQEGVQSTVTNLTIEPILISLGSIGLQVLMKCAPQLGLLIFLAAGASKVASAVPFVGMAMFMLSTVANIATIGETLIECLSCPAIDQTRVSLMMASSVQISHDPNDFQFPATAHSYIVKAFYDGGTTPVIVAGTVQPGTVGPIEVKLKTTAADGSQQDVASGGRVQAQVFFYSASGCLVGQGTSETLFNLPADKATDLVIPITIQEMLVPLDAHTSYIHQSKLSYSNGARRWDSSAPPPLLTHANLCQGNDGAVCALHGLTVHTASGMAGYGFNAGGQNVSLCTGGTAASLNTVQNVFLGDRPDSGLKFSSCGESQPIGIVYSPTGPKTGGQNFFLQQGTDEVYHLRSVDLGGGNFDMRQTLSWGRFSTPLDSLCVMNNGYVAGVNRSTNKMEVLRLPAAPSSTSNELVSVPFAALAGGTGSRVGLLDTPVAVCSHDGALLVLEQGNQRVQAFDPDGNAVELFTDANGVATSLLALQEEAGITYLDVAVEGAGYVYVLSYADSGSSAANYRLDVYTPTGQFLSRTARVAAGNIAVDLYRNVYTLNYETMANSPRVEPSLSQWAAVSTTPSASTTSNRRSGTKKFAAQYGVPTIRSA